jgi:hypothetical protein
MGADFSLLTTVLVVAVIAATGAVVTSTSKEIWQFVQAKGGAPSFTPAEAHSVVFQCCIIFCAGMLIKTLLINPLSMEALGVGGMFIGMMIARFRAKR